MTPVIFRKFSNGTVIAIFPDVLESCINLTCSCYLHIGQHSGADYSWVVSITKPAKKEEYNDLFNELLTLGYDDLVIRYRRSRKMYDTLLNQYYEFMGAK